MLQEHTVRPADVLHHDESAHGGDGWAPREKNRGDELEGAGASLTSGRVPILWNIGVQR